MGGWLDPVGVYPVHGSLVNITNLEHYDACGKMSQVAASHGLYLQGTQRSQTGAYTTFEFRCRHGVWLRESVNDQVMYQAKNIDDILAVVVWRVKQWCICDHLQMPVASYDAPSSQVIDELITLAPVLDTSMQYCPDCSNWSPPNSFRLTLGSVIIHLNDHHHWTRERIADWLDTLNIDLTIGRSAA